MYKIPPIYIYVTEEPKLKLNYIRKEGQEFPANQKGWFAGRIKLQVHTQTLLEYWRVLQSPGLGRSHRDWFYLYITAYIIINQILPGHFPCLINPHLLLTNELCEACLNIFPIFKMWKLRLEVWCDLSEVTVSRPMSLTCVIALCLFPTMWAFHLLLMSIQVLISPDLFYPLKNAFWPPKKFNYS